jgi:hypothetical protein
MKTTKLVAISLMLWTIAKGQTIRINEFSQGASGAKEWVELVVGSSTPINNSNCVLAKVNIAGWILDDNNGDFSPPNHFTGTGMATGHMRFKNEAPWNNLPIGAIIVIYNAADRDLNIPADDPFDWVNNDCVYIVPSNHSSLEYCTNLPAATSCTGRNNYATCAYVGTGTWANVGLANAGDAIQVRDVSFNLIHGLVYGKATSATGCTTTSDMIGNALAPVVTNVAMSGTSAAFNGSSDADYFDATKWVVQSYTLSTPGAYNNTTNETYVVGTLRGGCTCNRILPINQTDIQTTVNSHKYSMTIVDGVLITKNSKPHKQTIAVYDMSGRVLYKNEVFVRKDNALDLNLYYKSGVNLIRVLVDDNVQSLVFKHLK